MTCSTCGSALHETETDMPFKTGPHTIVIVKGLPVLQCGNCGAYLMEDPVMERVERILAKVDQDAELEVVGYAA